MELQPRGPEPSIHELGVPPKPPSTPAPSIRGVMGKRLVSSSGLKQDAEVPKKIFLGKLRDISEAIQEIEEAPLWEGSESLSGEALQGAISAREQKITDLEEQLKTAEGNLASSGTVLGRDYKQLSQQIMQIKAKLSVLRSSLELDKTLGNPVVKDAIQLAKQTQEACQKLSQMSRHNVAFRDPQTCEEYQKAITALMGYREQLSLMAVANGASLPTADPQGDVDRAMAAKICNEAIVLIRGTAQRVTTTLKAISPPIVNPGLTLHPRKAMNEAKEAFKTKRDQTVRVLEALGGWEAEPDSRVQRLTHSGRQIHAQEVHDLEESLRELETKTARLADKVAAGTATEADRQTVNELKEHLKAARQRYEGLSLTLGRKMSPEQFLSRAVASVSIEGLQKRIDAIEAAFSSGIEQISGRSTKILEQLSVAMKSKGQQRALAFYEACATLERLQDQVQEFAPENPLARTILQQKVEQLTSQVQSAAQTVFGLEGSPERAERESAIDIGSGVATPNREQAVPFLINVMTKLTMFSDVPDQEALALRATVDLCMSQMSPEELKGIPEELLQRYQEVPVPEHEGPSWAEQIKDVHKSIVEFGTQLAKTSKTLTFFGNYTSVEDQEEVLEAIEQLTVCEQKLANSKASLDPEVFTAYKDAFDRMNTHTPLEFTKKEASLIKSLPQSPTPEDKATIKLALAKLMFQAVHHPDERVRQAAVAQAFDLMAKMGFRNEYQSVFAELQNLKVMGEFHRTVLRSTVQSIHVPQTGTAMAQARARVDMIFSSEASSAGLQKILAADVFSEGLTAPERAQLEGYICLRQDLAFLKTAAATLPKKEASWDFAGRLQVVVVHVSSSPLREELDDDLMRRISDYRAKSSISDDKLKIASGILEGAPPKDARYYTERIVGETDKAKQLERMNAIVVPLLIEAVSGTVQHPTLVNALPQILSKLSIVNPMLLRSPLIIDLLAQYAAKQSPEAAAAADTFQRVRSEMPSYTPKEEWSDGYLEAAATLDGILEGLGVSPVLVSAAEEDVNSAILEFIDVVISIPNKEARKDAMGGLLLSLLEQATSDSPNKNKKLVAVLPQILTKALAADPNIFSLTPGMLPLLARYVTLQAATPDYRSMAKGLISAEAVAQAEVIFGKYSQGLPPYTPTLEWKKAADEYLKAATVLDGAYRGGTLACDGFPFVDVASHALTVAIEDYERHAVLENPDFIEAQKDLEELASRLSPEALKENGYEHFPELYQAYKEKENYVGSFLADTLPTDRSLEMKTKDFPHAQFLSTHRNALFKRITGVNEKKVNAGRSAYLSSEIGRKQLESGRRYITETLQQLKGLSPEKQREIVFSDSFRDGLKASMGNLPSLLFEELESALFHSLFETERSKVTQLAEDLGEGQTFDPVMFTSYTESVATLLLLSNVRYSGQYAQPLTDAQRSELYPSWHNPLLLKNGLENLKRLPGCTQEHAHAIDQFLVTTQPLQQNLEDFQLRVKDVTGRPAGYLEKEMRKAFQGFLDNVVGKRLLVLDVVGRDTKSPKYGQSFACRIEGKIPTLVPKDSLIQAQDKLNEAAEKLQSYGESILGSLSQETRARLHDPMVNKAVLFGEDTNLTPAKIQELASDGRIDEVLGLLDEAATLVKDDPVLFQQVKDLYAQVVQWFSIPLRDVVSSCSDPAVRSNLIRLDEKFRHLSKTVQ